MTDLLPAALLETPTRIDVYVDGSWLFRGKRNPVLAGGWGAVVVETYPDHQVEWWPSAAADDRVTCAQDAECAASIGALQAVREREQHRPELEENALPPIVLHTDYHDLPTVMARKRHQSPLYEDLWKLIEELKVDVVFARHDKSGRRAEHNPDLHPPEMATAHTLAADAAWEERRRRQNNMQPDYQGRG